MNLSELMQLFSSSETIHSLGLSDKILASLITTLLGVGITFCALIILLVVISWMRKLTQTQNSPEVPQQHTEQTDEAEIVAAITAAIAMTMQSRQSNIVIRNIRRVNDFHPQWNRAGIRSQLNSNLNR